MSDDNKVVSAYSFYETEAAAEKEGSWVDIGPFVFKVARAGGANEEFVKVTTKRLKPFANQLDSLPKAQADALAIGIFVDTILLDWKGVGDREGNPMAFSKENATKLLSELPNLFQALQEQASKMANFTKAHLDDVAKN